MFDPFDYEIPYDRYTDADFDPDIFQQSEEEEEWYAEWKYGDGLDEELSADDD